jgi:hypothetical protein
MPQYSAAILSRFLPTRLGRISVERHIEYNLAQKIDDNGPILKKLWLGEVSCCDGTFRSENSPCHNFINTMFFVPTLHLHLDNTII